ncbi:squalene/phytoene synthase family protein [Gemmobacter fulvus]|uniref:Squalene/phytoene synthase family protein n=1 Tax=Gemmobacter fulvus TaxID=2840474 RepID=A0A975S1E9_9RHOB|nr:squalene/phytoene synthase family protein [Gemmobacter fulvus]MBT9245095.1 squalene/phytoene synthase family protein [Gemmobacter fulvus]QWK90562.1 squalene/phytoene synthase family protein [Gemmobacter fulvus]
MSDACAAIVERADPERFAATMAAAPEDRAALFTLYAFNIEIARAPWASKEPMIAEMRLQWWRDAVEAEASGPGSQHEVMSPMGRLIRTKALPLAALDAMIAARRWDIYSDAHADAAALTRYLEDTGGTLMWLSCKALGATDETEKYAKSVGYAASLANYLRAVPQLEELGRVPLVDGRPAEVAALARDGLARLDMARKARLPRSALMAAHLTRPLLRLAASEPNRVAQGALVVPEFTRRRRLLWQAVTGRF